MSEPQRQMPDRPALSADADRRTPGRRSARRSSGRRPTRRSRSAPRPSSPSARSARGDGARGGRSPPRRSGTGADRRCGGPRRWCPAAETASGGVYSPKSSIQPSWPSRTTSRTTPAKRSRPAGAPKSSWPRTRDPTIDPPTKPGYRYGPPPGRAWKAPAAIARSKSSRVGLAHERVEVGQHGQARRVEPAHAGALGRLAAALGAAGQVVQVRLGDRDRRVAVAQARGPGALERGRGAVVLPGLEPRPEDPVGGRGGLPAGRGREAAQGVGRARPGEEAQAQGARVGGHGPGAAGGRPEVEGAAIVLVDEDAVAAPSRAARGRGSRSRRRRPAAPTAA